MFVMLTMLTSGQHDKQTTSLSYIELYLVTELLRRLAHFCGMNFLLILVKRQQWKLLKTDLRLFSLKRHFILKYISN